MSKVKGQVMLLLKRYNINKSVEIGDLTDIIREINVENLCDILFELGGLYEVIKQRNRKDSSNEIELNKFFCNVIKEELKKRCS